MASPHAGPLLGAGAALIAAGGIFMAVTGFEHRSTHASVWTSVWFTVGFVTVTAGLAVAAFALYLHFRKKELAVDEKPQPPGLSAAPESSGPPVPHITAIRMDGGAKIESSDVRIQFGPLIPPPEPPQIAVTESERQGIRQELLAVAQQIEDLLDDYPLSPPPVAAAYFGIEVKNDDWSPVLKRRRQWDEELGIKYVRDIRPRVLGVYEHARIRGFFDPELEERYTAHVICAAKDFPAMLRKLASQ